MTNPPNIITAALNSKIEAKDSALFKRLLWTGPLTWRIDQIAKKLNIPS